MSDEMPFPRDAVIDHLGELVGYNLESVIDFETEPTPMQWTATFEVGKYLSIPSVGGTFSISLMRERYQSFDTFLITFERKGRALGNVFITTRDLNTLTAVIECRLEIK